MTNQPDRGRGRPAQQKPNGARRPGQQVPKLLPLSQPSTGSAQSVIKTAKPAPMQPAFVSGRPLGNAHRPAPASGIHSANPSQQQSPRPIVSGPAARPIQRPAPVPSAQRPSTAPSAPRQASSSQRGHGGFRGGKASFATRLSQIKAAAPEFMKPAPVASAPAKPNSILTPPPMPASGLVTPGGNVIAPKLKIYALGGLEEIGRNCTVFECGDDILIVDIGFMFPEEGMPGIDYIIPNFSSLKGKEKNIRGVIVTHGHMDHIGGIPLTIEKLGYPVIYTAPLTAGIIRKRHEEFGDPKKLKVQLVKDGMKIALGKYFVFEPFHVNHNISDAFGAALHTPYGTILYTGDFKFDFTPVNDEPADLTHIASFGMRGTLAILEDSTNADSPGHQISEKRVGEDLEKIFQLAKGRIIIGTFSSLLTRAQQILTFAEKYGRKVLIQGRSMQTNIELAHSMGYMTFKQGVIIEDDEFRHMPDSKVVVIGTGAQGEKNAMLMRIANGEHRLVNVKKGDSFVFSSSVIPGNERTVQHLKDTLVKQGAVVYHYQNLDVHAGGHAKAEDLKLMLRLTKPQYLIPIHGNRFMLEAHKRLGIEIGIPEENCLVAENGQVIEFDAKGGRLTQERVDTDYVMVDGLGVGDVSHVVLRDRIEMSEDGVFIIVAQVRAKTGELVGSPDIISRGFVYMRDNKELIEKAREKAKRILKDADKKSPAFIDHIKDKLRDGMGQFLFSATKRRPMILPVIIEV